MSEVKTSESMLGDFRTDSRMLLLIAIALPLGVISAFIIGGWRATARIKSADTAFRKPSKRSYLAAV